ncbi:hypothetical protein EF405_04780 [Cyclobacteriaceae bacterium YHN15]|jgi:hypothetical protein|nr:hypothetical protein EF405_04780 [Cyclobacteriaceae bacterium YHN15]
MKIASLAEIKKELAYLNERELTDFIVELAKFTTDNKAFLFFKLFGRENPRLFIEMVQEELEMEFAKANTKHYHYAKKSAQAIRRKLNKNLKLTKDKTSQIELIIFFCKNLKLYGYLNFRHPVIDNLYKVQIGKAEKLISTLHEDLQYDFKSTLEDL